VGDAVLAELSDGLQDGNKFVRKTTIGLLVQLGDRLSPAILHAICSMLSDDDYVQKEALNAVVKLANRLDESSIALISDFIRSHDSRVRRVALTAAAAIGDRLPPDAVKDLTALLRSKEPNDRRPALQALSSLDKRLDLTVARFVMSALHDPNFMMAEVLEALTNFSSRFTAELICAAAEVLNAESDFFGHQAALALDKLSEQWTPQQIGALRTWLRPQSRAAKLMVAQHMKRLPELLSVDDTWPLVREVLTDREWHIETFKTIGGMADRFGPKYITMLREMLSEEDDHTRWATLKALGEVNVQLDAQTMRAMTGALEDAHEGVRQAAIEGLVGQPRSLPPEIIQAIAARIGDADDDVSRAAQTALAKISHKVDHDSVLFICTGLRQPEERIQHLCLTVLHDFYESGITIPTDKEVDTYMTSAN
jgi:HEAT repeat protein